MGDAAGELADRLHLLALAQGLFGPLTLLHLDLQLSVGVREIPRPGFQLEVRARQRGLGAAQHQHHQKRHEHQEGHAGVPRQGRVDRLARRAQID